MDLFDSKNKVKPKWGELGWSKTLDFPARKECQACFEFYETTSRYSERCGTCKAENKPKRKRIVNKLAGGESPF